MRILKEAGFNAIRSAHNSASRAMLEACDHYDMYVIDESFDMWHNRKTKHNYGLHFDACWAEDVTAMVAGITTIPASSCIPSAMRLRSPPRRGDCQGQGHIQGRSAADRQHQKKSQKDDKVQNGSLAFNITALFIGTGMNKGGNSPQVDALASPIIDALDVAGYNYGSGRYPLEEKTHPGHIILSSETFPQDIWKNWEMVKKYPYLLGDFMWTGWDYLRGGRHRLLELYRRRALQPALSLGTGGRRRDRHLRHAGWFLPLCFHGVGIGKETDDRRQAREPSRRKALQVGLARHERD